MFGGGLWIRTRSKHVSFSSSVILLISFLSSLSQHYTLDIQAMYSHPDNELSFFDLDESYISSLIPFKYLILKKPLSLDS
jgi:hypothetical protein